MGDGHVGGRTWTALLRAEFDGSARWWWRSAAGPTRPFWPGWPPTPSAPTRSSASPRCPRRWPPRSWPTAGPWPPSGGSALRRGRDRRTGRPGLLGQRRLPLLPLQDVPDGGARCRWPAAPACRPPPWCSGSISTTWATTGPASRPPPSAGARFPLVSAGFTKSGDREWSRQLGLRTWDKPAAACLASRVPYGTPVTLGTLRSVAEAESGLRALGFRQLRVRHYGDTARIEVPAEDLAPSWPAATRCQRGGAPGRLPVRHPRPRRVPLGQPQRGPRLTEGTPAVDRPPEAVR